MYYKRAERCYLQCNMLKEWISDKRDHFFHPHTSTTGYIMFYIIQGTLCKEMDLLTCYLHKSALYSWGPLFIAIVPLQAAMAALEWTPTQREFGWGRMVSVRGQLINTHECFFFFRGDWCMWRGLKMLLHWGEKQPGPSVIIEGFLKALDRESKRGNVLTAGLPFHWLHKS